MGQMRRTVNDLSANKTSIHLYETRIMTLPSLCGVRSRASYTAVPLHAR